MSTENKWSACIKPITQGGERFVRWLFLGKNSPGAVFLNEGMVAFSVATAIALDAAYSWQDSWGNIVRSALVVFLFVYFPLALVVYFGGPFILRMTQAIGTSLLFNILCSASLTTASALSHLVYYPVVIHTKVPELKTIFQHLYYLSFSLGLNSVLFLLLSRLSHPRRYWIRGLWILGSWGVFFIILDKEFHGLSYQLHFRLVYLLLLAGMCLMIFWAVFKHISFSRSISNANKPYLAITLLAFLFPVFILYLPATYRILVLRTNYLSQQIRAITLPNNGVVRQMPPLKHQIHHPPPTGSYTSKHQRKVLLLSLDAYRADLSLPKTHQAFKDIGFGCMDFTRAHSPATRTLHSTASMLTGLYPSRLARDARGISNVNLYISECLQLAGAQTSVLLGTSHLNQYGPVYQGFQTVNTGNSFKRSIPEFNAEALNQLRGSHPSFSFQWFHGPWTHAPYNNDESESKSEYLNAALLADQDASMILREAKKKNFSWMIVTSDHGEGFGEHGNRFHGKTLYQEDTHVPLLVCSESLKWQKDHRLVSLVDLFPTLASIYGLEPVALNDGINLLNPLATHAYILSEVPVEPDILIPGYAVWSGDWKIIVWPSLRTQEVFDLSSDPNETFDKSLLNPLLISELLSRAR